MKPLVGDSLDLEGAVIRIVDLDGGESAHAIALYVPSLRALIAGDAVYHDVHLWLAENRPEAWLGQLDRLAALGPIERVYPGHGAPGGPELLEANRAYLRAFLDAPADARQAAQALVARFPTWQLPIIAELSTAARK